MTNGPGNPKSDRNRGRRRRILDSLTVGSLVAGRSSCLILAGWAVLLGAPSALNAAAIAEAPFVADRAWTTEEGLPDNSVFSLQQTRDGYLWMGTGDGLARFDGIHFKTFEDVDARALNRGKIISLFEDSEGNLWIGTETAGILVLDAQGKLNNLGETGMGAESRLVTACEDPSGAVWISTAGGHVLRYRNGRRELKIADCNGLAADKSGIIWVGTRNARTGEAKLIGLGPISSPAAAISVAYEISIGPLDRLLASKDGGYWLLAGNRIQKRKLDQVERDYGPYPWNLGIRVAAACEDRSGNLIVGTYGAGIYWLEGQGKFVHLASTQGLSSTYVFSLCMDREENLWVGTDGGGLDRVKQQVFQVLARGLAIQSVCEDGQSAVSFGINNGGVNCWSNGVVRTYGRAEGLGSLDAPTVFVDRSNQVWVGTSDALFRMQTDRFAKQLPLGVSAIYQDRQGRLWFGTASGLISWDQEFSTNNGLSGVTVRAIGEDNNGDLWIGTSSGLTRLHDKEIAVFHPTNGLLTEEISAVYVDGENVIWVGTSSGLGRFDGAKWTRYSRNEGLVSNRVRYLAEDKEHYLWIGTAAGLMRVNKKELNDFARGAVSVIAWRPYGVADGLPIGQCSAGSQPAVCAARDGTMWFSTIKGLAFVRPEQIHRNTNPPPILIEMLRVQGRPQTTNSLRVTTPSSITIPASEEGLEIDYTSLNLAAPERALFKYRLQIEGRPSHWFGPASVRVAQYPKLPPGDYRFEVTACNEDGVWNEAGATLAVRVLPPFWRTTWFLTITTICLLGIIVGSVHYVSTQRLQRQVASLRQQEALEKERARIARDLHDQLGANLTQVALLGEMVETDKEEPEEIETHARQISATARETTHALDEIVWTVNPSNDTLDGLINYVCKYAQEYLALAGLRYRLEVPQVLPTTPISPELRHNVFLAAKEAVNNVVKHAQASSAWLRLQLEPHQFILEIEDNGRGLTAADGQKGRSGLRNMRKRMEDIGGMFESAPGAEGGTRIRLIAPLGKNAAGNHSKAS